MCEYDAIAIGKPLEWAKGRVDGCLFDMTPNGPVLFVCFRNPTEQELFNFGVESPLDIRYTVLNDEIFMLFKFGEENWCDAPYTPFESPGTDFDQIPEGDFGLLLTVVLADTEDGTVKLMRVVGLENRFSRSLIDAINTRRQKPYNRAEYVRTITMIRAYCPSAQMAENAKARYLAKN